MILSIHNSKKARKCFKNLYIYQNIQSKAYTLSLSHTHSRIWCRKSYISLFHWVSWKQKSWGERERAAKAIPLCNTQLLNVFPSDELSSKIWFNFLCLCVLNVFSLIRSRSGNGSCSGLLILLLSSSTTFKMHALYGFINLKLCKHIIHN